VNAEDEIVNGAELVIGEASVLGLGEEGDGDPPTGLDVGSVEAPAGRLGAVAVDGDDDSAGPQPTVRTTSATVSTRRFAAIREGWTRLPRPATEV